MTKHKKKTNEGKSVWTFIALLLGLGVLITVLLQGVDIALLNPKGYIAEEQLELMITSSVLMLIIAIPTLFMFYLFAWKYRESNENAVYEPHTPPSKSLVFCLWVLPTVAVVMLAVIMWPATQKLEPQKAISSSVEPLTVQVVAMRWKWLFIYPEYNIATVNFVQIPVDTPVRFELSADEAPMSSFWIPHFGGQLYAMTGHVNPLNLMAETPGDYPGSSAEINGAGFAGMKFTARASSQQDFDRWVREVQASANTLHTAEYANLLAPSEDNPVMLYSNPDPSLYATMLAKYTDGSHNHQPTEYKAGH